MKFRKLYWVTEQLDADGRSEVIGVFTSIFDLRSKGLRWDEGCVNRAGFRVSLVKLDSKYKPFGCWQSPDYDGLTEGLAPFVATGEFDQPSVDLLIADLKDLTGK